MREFNPKFVLLAASTVLAMAFTLSCSSDDDEGGDSPIVDTQSYKIVSIEEDRIVYEYQEEPYYNCTSEGLKLNEGYTYDEKINYSIANNVLTAWDYQEERASKFNGNSSTVIGTWTRNKDIKSSCKEVYDEEYDETYTRCEDFYAVTKMVITESTIAITSEYCITDRMPDARRGWKLKATGCNTYEMSKGTEKIFVKVIGNGGEATYKGKTCKDLEPSVTKQEQACNYANEKVQAEGRDRWDYYDEFIEADFMKCVKDNNFPQEVFGGESDSGGSEEAAKAKISLR